MGDFFLFKKLFKYKYKYIKKKYLKILCKYKSLISTLKFEFILFLTHFTPLLPGFAIHIPPVSQPVLPRLVLQSISKPQLHVQLQQPSAAPASA